MARFISWFKTLGQLILLNLVLFFLLEGTAGLALAVLSGHARRVPYEARHTRYDPVLGWSNLPNVYVPDMYGAGVHLSTNSKGFRGRQEYEIEVPDGKTRIICSGDSFTLGFGVDDESSWCAQLGIQVPELETLNMGQGGYGIDQAYLWYLRDGTAFDHNVHLFAFVKEDFYRMARDHFGGYGKPFVSVEADGSLKATPVPVPWGYRERLRRWALSGQLDRFRELNLFRLFSPLYRHFFVAPGREGEQVAKIRGTALRIFEDLDRINREKDSKLVLVYLPTDDMGPLWSPDDWGEWLQAESKKRGIFFIDMVTEIRSLAVESWRNLFRPHGHYSIKGNSLVAYLIYRKLVELNILSGEA